MNRSEKGYQTKDGVKAEATGRLLDVHIKALSLEQMEIARLEAALVRVRMESHILKNSGRFARKSR
tara:strand:- start:240 stop:437 length:198 start_codon:yes stop_codon:yes gene_type:complete